MFGMLLNMHLTHNLPVADTVEHRLEGLGLEHHVLNEVNIKVVQVHRANGLCELGLQLVNFILESPHLPNFKKFTITLACY